MNDFYRGRRLRMTDGIRNMMKETRLHPDNLIYPLFLVEGIAIKQEISSLSGQYHFSVDMLDDELDEIMKLGIPAVILFGLPSQKDEKASSAYYSNGVVQEGIRKIKNKFPKLIVITDVCLCQYMSHGHCGVFKNNQILNDESLKLIAKTARSHAEAGADMVAPSDMMDGRIMAIREILDENGFEYVSIMSYTVKYASAFYGPFRDASHSEPKLGNRKSYQMDPPNAREALREAEADIMEGSDIIMVKPALAYLDVIYRLKNSYDSPVAAYNVSGEYAMIKTAVQHGLLDEKNAVLETLTGIKRAGADLIITYFAKNAAKWLKELEL